MTKERLWIDALYEAQESLRYGKEDLAGICRALHLVGQSVLADRLGEIAVDMNDANVKIKEGINLSLGQQVKASEEATSNMLQAALAVAR